MCNGKCGCGSGESVGYEVMPRAIHDQHRLNSLFQAVLRAMTGGLEIPEAWVLEINEIIVRYSRADEREASR